MAKKHDKPVQFVVGEATFDDETKAYVSLVETTEKFVNEFATPKTCSVSGTTTVAGKSCGCSVEAGKRAELVKKAMEDVKMTFKVGTESTCCNDSAKALAKKSGEEIKFVVNEKEICCNYQARLELAKAKYAAAVKALAATETVTTSETKVGT